MKTQVVVIHGGHALDVNEDFIQHLKDYNFTINNLKPRLSWKDHLQQELGDDFEVFTPKMPNKENAKYVEWKTWFEKCTPFLQDDLVFVGHSLGGLFLAKYLSENVYPKKIKGFFVVAAPFWGKTGKHQRNDNFTLNNDFKSVYQQVLNINFFHSKDDPIVPLEDFEMYKEKLGLPATFKLLDGQGHFNESHFPELVSDIKNLTN